MLTSVCQPFYWSLDHWFAFAALSITGYHWTELTVGPSCSWRPAHLGQTWCHQVNCSTFPRFSLQMSIFWGPSLKIGHLVNGDLQLVLLLLSYLLLPVLTCRFHIFRSEICEPRLYLAWIFSPPRSKGQFALFVVGSHNPGEQFKGTVEFFRGFDDFIIEKVYLLRLMPVCVGLIMVSCLFLSFPPMTSGV
jgi:hypothetical protein